MAADYKAIRAEYIAGTASMRALAEAHGVKLDTLERRASRERWVAARKAMAVKVTAKTDERMLTEKVDELTEFNAADLKLARALRSQIAKHLNAAVVANELIDPKTLRDLTASAESIQRIGRLILGASTAKNEHTGDGGGPLEVKLMVYIPANGRDDA